MFPKAKSTKAAAKRMSPMGKGSKVTRKGITRKRIPRTNKITEIKKVSLVGALSFIFSPYEINGFSKP